MTDHAGDSRLRVLTLTRDIGADLGGQEVLVCEFARRLDPARFRSYLCMTRRPLSARAQRVDQEREALTAAGVTVVGLERGSSLSLLPWGRLWRLLRDERIDIVHAHMPRASVPGAVLARMARVPVVISHEHGSVLDRGKHVRKFLDRHIVARFSDAMLAVSEFDRQNLIVHEHIRPEQIRVFRHGIPRPAPSEPPALDLGPPGVPVVGAVGRLSPIKGFHDLIRAIAEIKRRGREIRCVIAGDGPERGRLEALIDELGVSGEVELLGFRTDVLELLRAVDVAVMSSHSEGGPLAIIEYMAVGTPIVATRVGGIPELVEDGVHGLLVPPREPEALAAAIEQLLDDRDLAQGLGERALERQRSELDVDVTVRRLEELYLELFRARAGR
jgi:glycosyltransferase involved in cell wall biosynthesis